MSDLVERLRDENSPHHRDTLHREAADEVIRLRDLLTMLPTPTGWTIAEWRKVIFGDLPTA